MRHCPIQDSRRGVRGWDVRSGPFKARLAAGGVGVKTSGELDGGAVRGLSCAPAPLRRVRRHLPQGRGRMRSRRFTPVYGCSKNTRKPATSCHDYWCFYVHIVAKILAPHVESAPEDRNWSVRFQATEKPRGRGCTKSAMVDRRCCSLCLTAAGSPDFRARSGRVAARAEFRGWGPRKEYAPEFLPGRGKVNVSHA